MEAEGDSDITINDLPVVITTSEASGTDFNDPDDIIVNVSLYADGEKLATESLVTSDSDNDSETVTFDDLDFTIDAGDEVEFVVKAKIQDTGTGLDDGDTISVDITSTERGNIDAEDETGEELESGDKTGTATGETHAVYDIGMDVQLVSVAPPDRFASETSGSGDQGTFVIVYSVTAFDGDIYVDKTCTEDNDGTYVASEGTTYTLTNSASNSSTCDLDAEADATESSTSFEVEEGETINFTLTISATASADAIVQAAIPAIGWVATTDGQGSNTFTFNLDEFETTSIPLNVF